MLGTGLQLTREGDDHFYNAPKARGSNYDDSHHPQPQNSPRRALSDICSTKSPWAISDRAAQDDLRTRRPSGNLNRFLQSVTPSVPAQFLSKTTMRGLWTFEEENQPYFVLGDLWEAFKEWSAYGAGVPLILNESDCVIQYYVPYLSGIQIYCDPAKICTKPRWLGEDSDSDFRDSSSDSCSDCEPERGQKCPCELCNQLPTNKLPLRMNQLSLRDHHVVHHDDLFSDEGESSNFKDDLLFQYLEHDTPYGREPLADKISDFAARVPALKTLRSCDLLPSSWISVAWYPIYRIPTGPTLKDLDACFLTYHSLNTPLGGSGSSHPRVVKYPSGSDGMPKISLPVFGLASYKFKGSSWTSNGDCDCQLGDSLLQAADNLLRLCQVRHPDFDFFCSR